MNRRAASTSLIFLGMLLGILTPAWSQNYLQNIRGTVRDAYSDQPIVGARVFIPEFEEKFVSQTDDNGHFILKNVPAGRHVISVKAVGYQLKQIPEAILHSGKELLLNISLTPMMLQTEQIMARLVRTEAISGRTISVEQTKRFPAAYFDPARVAVSYPGVVQDNDQANHLVIRGNSPNGVLWSLEGIEIVNPNHTANAGTFSDRATASGGGTNIMSTQLMDNVNFTTSAWNGNYGKCAFGHLCSRFSRRK